MQNIPPLVILVSLLVTTFKLVTGRVHFRRARLGRTLVADDGRRFTVFRNLECRPFGSPPSRPAVFVARFRFARFDSTTNRRLSWIPVPLIIGHRGFREKVWVEDLESGYWQGLYEWSSEHAADTYTRSFVLRVMCKRAIAETIEMKVVPDTTLDDYLAERLES